VFYNSLNIFIGGGIMQANLIVLEGDAKEVREARDARLIASLYLRAEPRYKNIILEILEHYAEGDEKKHIYSLAVKLKHKIADMHELLDENSED